LAFQETLLFPRKIDLQLSRFPGDPTFDKAHWYWKLSQDPEIRDGVMKSDWQNIDYLLLNHEFVNQLGLGNLPGLENTVKRSKSLIKWGPSTVGTSIDLEKLSSTNGDWIEVRQILDRTQTDINKLWENYNVTFIDGDGKVTDTSTNITTSEGQSYAMLRAIAADDKDTFRRVWIWTKNHLQFRNEDKLFSWKWGKNSQGKEGVLDPSPAADADIDIATALLLASKKWNIPEYEEEAKVIIPDIWKQLVYFLPAKNRYYLLAGTWAQYGSSITVNPSYMSPASYRLFAQVDTKNDWLRLTEDTYKSLYEIASLSTAGLIPDWIGVNRSGAYVSPNDPNQSRDYGYDAMRIWYRISQDYLWFNSNQAFEYLKRSQFLFDYLNQEKKIYAVYTTAGTPTVAYEDEAMYGALLPVTKILHQNEYENIKEKIKNADGNNYYTQNWIALGLAVAEGKIKP
jgi:endoglucanase